MKHRNIMPIMLIVLSLSLLQVSCKKFLEIDPPTNSLVPQSVFDNDDVATSAVLGLYSNMVFSGYASGDQNSIATLCGLTADEFIGYSTINKPFYQNLIPADNSAVVSVWLSIYQRIYAANSILEGLSGQNGVTPPVKARLQGEALFVRAFNYFYLVNLYGPVPLQLTTNYQENSQAVRAPVADVYQQIVADLQTAEPLLGDNYVTNEKVRPNKATVDALLARTYLYMQDWANAEKYSSLVIGKTNLYTLAPLDNVFLKNSSEAIWQLMPPANSNTASGSLLILTAAPTIVSLTPGLAVNAFEANDKRRSSWVQSLTVNSVTYYYPYKYKVKSSTTVSEYSMVFRLAEQFLIRAEAETYGVGNGINGAIADLNIIRNRAGLPNYTGAIDAASIRTAILHERQVELFSEWGHRWFDLKRTGNANSVLGTLKANWKSTAVLFPISKDEITRNPKINQNDGY